MRNPVRLALRSAITLIALCIQAGAGDDPAALGPRPFYLVDDMDEGDLKSSLAHCSAGPFEKSRFSIGHRGAALQFPEHTEQSYRAAASMGAGIVECDVTFTKDMELVCRHSQCDLHTTTNILAIPELASQCSEPFTPADPETGSKANAKCCTSDITLKQFRQLSGKMDSHDPSATTVETYMGGDPSWRTSLYASSGRLMTHAESIALFRQLGVGMTPEVKRPEVSMPFLGTFSQEDFLRKLVGEYTDAGVAPEDVYIQSFDLNDIKYLIEEEPAFGALAVYLESRTGKGFDPERPQDLSPTMDELVAGGVTHIAPPIWVLLSLDTDGRIRPSAYAEAAKSAGLNILTWTLERSGPLNNGGGWYFRTISDAIDNDGDVFTVLDVLAGEVGVVGVFSDWPATTTYYANCMGLK